TGAGNASMLQVIGAGKVVMDPSAGTSLTIKTQQGDDASTYGGSVDLGGNQLSALITGRELTIDTSSAGSGGVGGAVNLGLAGSAGGAYLKSLTVNSRGAGGTGSHGL